MTGRIAFALTLAGIALPAHAYLDPATGSMLIQLFVGGVAGLAVVIKVYWRKITSFFQKKDDSV